MPGKEEEEFDNDIEERLMNEEYKIWKRNTPFLYGEPPDPQRCPPPWRSRRLWAPGIDKRV